MAVPLGSPKTFSALGSFGWQNQAGRSQAISQQQILS